MLVSPVSGNVVYAEESSAAVTEAVTELPYEVEEQEEEGVLTAEEQSILDYLDVNNSTNTIDLVLLITIISIAPSLLVMMTCFTRLIISFSLLRNAMGIATTPPNQVLVGLALFMTLFIMNPVLTEMNETAYVPYKNGEYTTMEAVKAASVPLKEWMLKNTSNESMSFFINLTDSAEELESATDAEFLEKVPFTTVVPAFILSELKIGFQIGFMLYIPFLVIDVVVASVLMSMGMMMLPPVTISMPFKLMLFVLADGWSLLIGSLVTGFN
ncbi:MAG: flagellar type III secretion system pore protein FliP [Oscillospiraceae bacterium]|nr:flagellar type III secretion system pore protein FliP [Oscillospiraceae bacterium]